MYVERKWRGGGGGGGIVLTWHSCDIQVFCISGWGQAFLDNIFMVVPFWAVWRNTVCQQTPDPTGTSLPTWQKTIYLCLAMVNLVCVKHLFMLFLLPLTVCWVSNYTHKADLLSRKKVLWCRSLAQDCRTCKHTEKFHIHTVNEGWRTESDSGSQRETSGKTPPAWSAICWKHFQGRSENIFSFFNVWMFALRLF